jgi:hypothetical protein
MTLHAERRLDPDESGRSEPMPRPMGGPTAAMCSCGTATRQHCGACGAPMCGSCRESHATCTRRHG